METNPVYKLEKVMKVPKEDLLQDFEGPLDVILFLLSKHKVDIQDISISQILEQYVAWLELRQSLDLEVASEFITMASQLMFIKTRMLLSLEDAEAQSEMDALIQSLEERRRGESYATVKAMALTLEPLGVFGQNIFVRYPEPIQRQKVITYSHDAGELVLAMAEIQNRAQRALPPPREAFEELVGKEPYPVEHKSREILEKLRNGGLRFLRLFRGNRSRSEVVATFLAVLELCRGRMIAFADDDDMVMVQPNAVEQGSEYHGME
ncbi:segregation/condensation protein A [Bengtsoniella intestinalis]|uniref:segregation and condensation protein A n=1 Tax=Bengtsoniella intestinalis TaxID=3073143 RepID=UPI00391F72AF